MEQQQQQDCRHTLFPHLLLNQKQAVKTCKRKSAHFLNSVRPDSLEATRQNFQMTRKLIQKQKSTHDSLPVSLSVAAS